jgi:hypothetical protein
MAQPDLNAIDQVSFLNFLFFDCRKGFFVILSWSSNVRQIMALAFSSFCFLGDAEVASSPYTATHLPGGLGVMFLLLYGSKCSSPSTICHTRALKQQRSWSQNVSCGQACRRIVTPGHGFAKPASAPKAPATLQWKTYVAGSPFTSHPYRPRGASSNVSRLHILPHCS